VQHRPEIWRRLDVPGSIRLDHLHLVFQAAMGWRNTHLHQFRVGDVVYGAMLEDDEDDDESEPESEHALCDVVTLGARFFYDYDFGDDWVHEIRVDRISHSQPLPSFAVCTEGSNACPPEDSGGTGGYAELLAALRDPRHQDHAEYLKWVGANFDPARFNLAQVNAALQRVK
jgi:hypothetical protein